MAKKKRPVENERFSAKQYFESDDTFCPFKDVKLKPKEEKPVSTKPSAIKPVSRKVYDMYTPSPTNVVQKVEQLPLSLLRECAPQESIDLHGKKPSRDDIPSLVNEFLEECLSKGRKKVEIIVGKGNHSSQEPVIPELVEVVLKRSPIVRDYETAPANKGGSGAFWIILGKKPAQSVNVYSTKASQGVDIKGLDGVKRANAASQKPKGIDYDSYLPEVDDILDKF